MMMMITIILRMMITMMKGFLGCAWAFLGSSEASFRAVFGHFEALQERSKTKPKVEHPRHLDFSRMSRAKSLFSSVGASKQALRTAVFLKMSRAKTEFLNIRAIPRIHFFDDVSSETIIFNIKRLRTTLSTSSFFRGRLERNAHFWGEPIRTITGSAASQSLRARAPADLHATRHGCTWGADAGLP